MAEAYDLGDDSHMRTQCVEIDLGSEHPVEVYLPLGKNASQKREGQGAL